MKFGRFDVFQFSEGLFKLTDTFMEEFAGDDPISSKREPKFPARLLVSINIVVLLNGDNVILCDTGIGTKHRNQACDYPTPDGKTKSIKEQLSLMNIQPEDVTHILLTHLHYDHSGGLTCINANDQLILSFPNANIFVQNEEWEAAEQSVYKQSKGYLSENWALYRETSNLHLVDGDESIADGITLIKTNGHTKGHQIVKIDSGDGQVAAFFGDLIPTPSYFSKGLKMKFDYNPDKSKSMRTNLIDEAVEEDWLLFFYHAPHVKAGRAHQTSNKSIKVKKIVNENL